MQPLPRQPLFAAAKSAFCQTQKPFLFNTTPANMAAPATGGTPPPLDPQAQAEHNAKTLWVGNVTPGMDEAMLMQLFTSAGETPAEVKVMRDKFTNQAAGYGFATFTSSEIAQRALTNLNGQTAPGTQYTYALFPAPVRE